MRINKNLAEAVLMLSCIVLVLVGTTDFDSSTTKSIIMGILAVLAVTMGLARFLGNKNTTQEG
ncbi:MAG TPA: hypothetical protein H9778_02205 [Candidatus Parabacteroides intestinavium]|nr:hypothetical protein [Candidatus Parabacteroides intestinavium]